MKTTLAVISAISALPLAAWSQSALPEGTVADDVQFGVFNADGALITHRLSDYPNHIVALFYYTPW